MWLYLVGDKESESGEIEYESSDDEINELEGEEE